MRASAECPPRVTVIMTHFGAGEFLREAVLSVLRQSFKDLELMVVDDCSPGTRWWRALGDLAADPRLRLLRTDANVGTYRIKNRALELVTSPYVAFQDADDRSHRDRLWHQLRALSSGRADIVGTSFRYVDSAGIPRGGVRMPRLASEWARLGKRFVLLHSTVVARREVLDLLGGFDGTTRVAADTDFSLRAACLFRIRNLGRRLYDYRRHAGSLTRASATGRGSQERERYMHRILVRDRQRRAAPRRDLPELVRASPTDVAFNLLPVVPPR